MYMTIFSDVSVHMKGFYMKLKSNKVQNQVSFIVKLYKKASVTVKVRGKAHV